MGSRSLPTVDFVTVRTGPVRKEVIYLRSKRKTWVHRNGAHLSDVGSYSVVIKQQF